MSTATWKPLPALAKVTHWVGCLLASAVVLLFVVIAIGNGLPPLAAMNASFAAVGVMLVGLVLVWWKDWLGGAISLIGLAWFQAIEIAVNGQASGGLFPLFVVPGVLALVAGLTRGIATAAAK